MTTGRLLAIVLFVLVVIVAAIVQQQIAPVDSEPLAEILQEYVESGVLEDVAFAEREVVAPDVGLPNGLKELLEASSEKPVYERYLANCLAELNNISETDFDAININMSPSENAINVYVIREDPAGLLAGTFPWGPLENNMAYVGIDSIILCDARLLDYLSGKGQVDPIKDARFQGFAENQAKLIWLWMLGHEIGHIAHGHGSVHRFVAADNSFQLSADMDKEVQADRFAVSSISGEFAPIDGFKFMNTITGFLTRDCRRHFGKYLLDVIWRDDVTKDMPIKQALAEEPLVLRVPRSTTHPPIFVRALHLSIDLNARFDFQSPWILENVRDRLRIETLE